MDMRILSFNIHKGIGWAIRRSTLNQLHTQIRDLHPDIIFLQEVRGNQFEFLATDIWPHFSYGKNVVYTKGDHGNAILSKYNIIYSENIDLSVSRFEKRGLLHSIIQTPITNTRLHLFCVHLGLFRKDRAIQLAKIVNYIQHNIEQTESLILAGDFNDWSGAATIPLINELGLNEAFLDKKGNYAKTFPAWAPVLSLDRLYYRGFLAKQVCCLTQSPWRVLSDHLALEVNLQRIILP